MTKVLIVDDELNVRSILESYLEAEGYETTSVSDVREAEAALAGDDYHLVTLDINMPGESGLDFLDRVRTEHPETAILMVTVINDMATAKRAIEHGAYGYIRKPFDREEMIIGVHSALRRRELEITGRTYQSDLETKVRRRTRELARSEERYRRLVEKMSEGLASIDSERRITYVNRKYCEMLGYEEDEILGRLQDDFVDGSWLDHMKKQIARRREGIEDRYELGWRTKTGDRIHTMVSPSAIFDDDGTFRGGFAVLTDITELKRTEAALVKELKASTALAETAGRLVSSVNLDEISQNILEKAKHLTESEYGFVGYIDPITGFLVAPTLSSVVWEQCQKETGDTVFEKFTGLWGWALTHKKPILTNNVASDERASGIPAGHVPIKRFLGLPAMLGERVVGLIGLANSGRDYIEEDIRVIKPYADLYAVALERKRYEDEIESREKSLREILDSIAAGIMIIDRETHVITEINPMAARMIAAEKEDIVGQKCWNFIHPSTSKSCPLSDSVSGIESCERILYNAQGLEIPIFKTVVPITISGRPHFLETFLDVTEQKKMEIQLAQTQKLESIGQLAAGVAHEINTPIQYVGDNTRFLKEVFADLFDLIEGYEELTRVVENGLPTQEAVQRVGKAVEEYDLDYLKDDIPKSIEQTLEGVDRISTIVGSMRQFAHTDRGSRSPVDLHKMIESTAVVARNEYKYVADLTLDFDPTLPPVPCLAGEFNQVVLNLIVNAAHAVSDKVGDGSQGKGAIAISTRNLGQWVEIKVEDTGVGIPRSIRPRIFDPFFTSKEVGKGTGQGLAIAHSVIVEKHGGKIWFETEEGKGAAFFIRLPLNEKDYTES